MTNQELEYLLRRVQLGPIDLERLTSGGANDGDIIVWDEDLGQWVPQPPSAAQGTVRGVSVDLNMQIAGEEQFALAVHNLGTIDVSVTLLSSSSGMWTLFSAPWRVVDPNSVEVRVALGYQAPARAIIQGA